jgi:hypothetical protein
MRWLLTLNTGEIGDKAKEVKVVAVDTDHGRDANEVNVVAADTDYGERLGIRRKRWMRWLLTLIMGEMRMRWMWWLLTLITGRDWG